MTPRFGRHFMVSLLGVWICVLLGAPPIVAQETAAADQWIESLSDPSFKIRLKAVLLIGKYKVSRAALKLRSLLKDEQETVRAAAAHTLGQLGDQGARVELVGLLSQSAPLVFDSAEKALALLDAAQGRPKLFLAVAAPTLAVGVPTGLGSTLADKLSAKLRARTEVVVSTGEEAVLADQRLAAHLKKRSLTGFLLNPRITRLQSKVKNGSSSATCEVSVMVATLVDKRMEFAANGEATAEVEGAALSDAERDELYGTLLEASVNAAAEQVLERLNNRMVR